MKTCINCGQPSSNDVESCVYCGKRAMIQSRDFGANLQELSQSFMTFERAIITLILGVALTMFFFPLIVIHIPIVGDMSVSGYELLSRAKQFQPNIDAGVSPESQRKASKSVKAATNGKGNAEIPDVPPSLRIAWTMPLLVFATFTFAGLTLISVFAYADVTSALGIVGGLCGVLAIVNVIVIGSDFKTWLAQSRNVAQQDNPFAGIGALMFNSFNLTVGIGLCALTFCLFLTAFFVHTRVLSRVRLESQ
jgi:hypothetical protein